MCNGKYQVELYHEKTETDVFQCNTFLVHQFNVVRSLFPGADACLVHNEQEPLVAIPDQYRALDVCCTYHHDAT